MKNTAWTRPALVAASVIALLQTAWAAFLWSQIWVAHRGGDVVCLGGGHCSELWSSPFANAVHAGTGLPIAAWGVVWGVAAVLSPAIARWRLGGGHAIGAWAGASVLVAIAGIVGAAVLLSASLSFGHLCASCVVIYVLILGYTALVFGAVGLPAVAELVSGAPLVLGIAAAAVAALYVPGRNTPQSLGEKGAKSVESVPTPTPQPTTGAGQTADERLMLNYIQSLDPDQKQLLSDTLAAYAMAPVVTLPPARTTLGPEPARISITEFSDTLCGHCAQMQQVLRILREKLGPDAFSLSPHQYPLDASCNAHMGHGGESHPLRCLAAKVQICAEGRPNEFEFVSALFENQASLDEAKLWELAANVGPRAELEACAALPETEKKLQDDIAWAQAHGIQGTPFMFVNGRQAMGYPPLLLVLALTHGAPNHPAYATLPTPQPLPK